VLRVLTVPKVLRVLVPRVLRVLMVLVVLGGCSNLRVKAGVYANLDEVRKAGAGNWVPEGLPPGTSDLREGHLPDGRHWGAFSFPGADAAPIRALLGPEVTTGTLSCDPPGRLEFWPRVLQSPVDVERVRSTGFRLYTGRDARTYAINWGQGRVYYWR
jgi:hypothetical protein